MRFNGSRFPLNPSLAPAATAAQLKTAEMLTMLLNPDGYIPCRKNEPGVLQNYFGFVNNRYEIRMTLLFKGTLIEGSYFYESQQKDIGSSS